MILIQIISVFGHEFSVVSTTGKTSIEMGRYAKKRRGSTGWRTRLESTSFE